MTIRLLFNMNRDSMHFIVRGREIYYSDKHFKEFIRCMPPPENFMKAVALSRNRISANFINMFRFTEEEIKQYNEAKDEEALAELVKIDAKSRGCIFIKQAKEEENK